MLKVTMRTDEVAEALARRNISQNSLAQKIGVSSGYISQILTGARCPSPEVRERLMRELRLDFDSLFVIENERKASA